MVNSPIPQDFAQECRKCAKILTSFSKTGIPGKGLPTDQFIPNDILNRAKGVAILTVIKAGFVWAGRAGSGLALARLPDGSWSAPSAIGTAGMSFGGQIGAEVTDFVIVLNTESAVKAFSHGGNVTLGGNLSVSAGPWGRTGEVAGTVANMAAIYSYSKSKGLFAGISIEGSVIIERKDENARFYKAPVTSQQLLQGHITPPAEARELYQALSKFQPAATPDEAYQAPYATNPSPFAGHQSSASSSSHSSYGRQAEVAAAGIAVGAAAGAAAANASNASSGLAGNARKNYNVPTNVRPQSGYSGPSYQTPSYTPPQAAAPPPAPATAARPNRGPPPPLPTKPSARGPSMPTSSSQSNLYPGSAQTEDAHPPPPAYSTTPRRGSNASQNGTTPKKVGFAVPSADQSPTMPHNSSVGNIAAGMSHMTMSSSSSASSLSGAAAPPAAGARPTPAVPTKPKPEMAVALFDFAGEQDGDLAFSKGDLIVVVKKSESTNEWWTGRCHNKEGVFPANYVQIRN
ncbi:hypothetical protein RI367_001320 [Sorochytrium milnesiophthora]